MKASLLAHALTMVALLAPSVSRGEVLPESPDTFVSDPAGVVSSRTEEQLNRKLEDYERESSNQLLVAVFDKMQSSSSIEDYTVRLAQKWGAGREDRDNGAILFVFIQDRQMFLQVGYGLEPSLTDFESKRIVDDLKGFFRSGDYDGGISWAVDSMIEATKGEFVGNGRTSTLNRQSGIEAGWLLFLFMVSLGLYLYLAKGLQAGRTFGGSGSTTYWGTGSGGGWSGGGGGSFGGFSGGGGSFGGGGAGGGW